MTVLEDERSAWTPPKAETTTADAPPPPASRPPWLGSGETPPARGRHERGRFLLAALLVVASLAAGAAAGMVWASPSSPSPISTSAPTSTATSPASGSPDLAGVAAAVDPAVVDINTKLGYQQAAAAGTGVVLTSSGEVLTNNHVIDGATSITATDLGNGKTYTANVVGYDVTDDLAVLQLVGASNLSTAKLATSSISIGDPVVALGNAGGAGGTPAIASGTVTQLGVSITASDGGSWSEQLAGLIQTDTPLQPGDSGGPLVNTKNQVVGIDTAASAQPGLRATAGQSFAIPIKTAVDVAARIEAGKASATVHIGPTAFLGVQVGTGSVQGGVVVAGVEPGTPAANAGISTGDVIVTIDGTAVSSPSDLSTAIQQHRPGDRMTIAWNDQAGTAHTATVTLQTGPAA